MLYVAHVRAITRIALVLIDAHSPAAEELIVGTAAQESGLVYLRQLGGGPARGLWQMEPATHNDIWETYLGYREPLAARLRALLAPSPSPVEQLESNLAYAAAIARVRYLRAPGALPEADDIAGLAAYWKAHYNTAAGKGTVEEFVANYRRIVKG